MQSDVHVIEHYLCCVPCLYTAGPATCAATFAARIAELERQLAQQALADTQL
jgi:hypothetical protein